MCALFSGIPRRTQENLVSVLVDELGLEGRMTF